MKRNTIKSTGTRVRVKRIRHESEDRKCSDSVHVRFAGKREIEESIKSLFKDYADTFRRLAE